MKRRAGMRIFLSGLIASAFLFAPIAVAPTLAAEKLLKLRSGSLPATSSKVRLGKKAESAQLVVSGKVMSNGPARLGIRMDDRKSRDYASRYNLEQQMAPGPFTLRIPLKGLRAPDGRLIEVGNIKKLVLFKVGKEGRLKVSAAHIEEMPRLTDGVIALSFGPEEAPLFAGFDRVIKGDPRLKGDRISPIQRPGVDPLLAASMRHVERFTDKVPNGDYRVTLFTEETSAWHRLPEILKRIIKINGKVVHQETHSPNEWLNHRYFDGLEIEADAELDLWTTYGEKRGGLITKEVSITNGMFDLELSGEGLGAQTLSAILLEPKGTDALTEVRKRQRVAFLEKWQIDRQEKYDLPLDANLQINKRIDKPVELLIARRSGSAVHFDVTTGQKVTSPEVQIIWDNPKLSNAFKPMIWAAQRRLERLNAIDNLFVLKNEMLRRDIGKLPIHAEVPRRYSIWLAATSNAPIGTHRGHIIVGSGEQKAALAIEVTVPNIVLPAPAKPAGFYLNHTSHWHWHHSLEKQSMDQLKCDLSFLQSFNITGNAPALTVPVAKRKTFIRETQEALRFATNRPWLAYSAAFNLFHFHGIEKGARALGETERALRSLRLPTPVWSMADEPSNPRVGVGKMIEWITAARKEAPQANFGGHLNHKGDDKYLKYFNTVLINDGYGIDTSDFEDVREAGVVPWLYNTGRPRVSAGIWLWRTGADRYLQWHGRLPAGDPFDPTDGIEADKQIFYPMKEVCAAQPDVNINLLEMADGVVDQQWLTWLDNQPDPRAKEVKQMLIQGVGNTWESIKDTNRLQLKALRHKIGILAQRLNQS